MRQAGILAAAGIYALTRHVDRLAEDHRRAIELASALKKMKSIRLAEEPQTNMVILGLPWDRFVKLRTFAEAKGIKLSSQRLVLHRDISDQNLATIIDNFRAFDEKQA